MAIFFSDLTGPPAREDDGHSFLEAHMNSNVTVMPSRGFRGQLREAMDRRQVVRVERQELEVGCFSGYIQAIGADAFLMWVINDDLSFGGFRTLRHIDVTDLEFTDREDLFYRRALELQGLAVPPPAAFPLDRIEDIVQAASERSELISLELDDPDEHDDGLSLFVGKYVGEVGGDQAPDGFMLREVTPQAQWMETPSYFDWDEILSVCFGDNYAHVLFKLAQTSPVLQEQPPVKQRT
jgi:hypothetical protein